METCSFSLSIRNPLDRNSTRKTKRFSPTGREPDAGGCRVKFQLRNLTVDHIKPLEKGGSDRPSNLQLLCGTCNSMKGAGTQRQLLKRLEQQKLVKAQPKKSPKTPASKSTSSKGKKTPNGKKEKNKDPIGALFEAAKKEEAETHRMVVGGGGS